MSTPLVRSAALAALLLALPAAAAAQAAPAAPPTPRTGPSFGLVLEFGVEMGGDRFAETYFEDGSTQTMDAGQGGTLAAGVEVRPSHDSPLAFRATAGYKFVTTKATNADIFLGRVPVELVASYDLPGGFRVGGGYVRHTMVRFYGGGVGEDVSLRDANGLTAEAGWRWVALTYTMLDYTDESGKRYDASSAGLTVSATLRR